MFSTSTDQASPTSSKSGLAEALIVTRDADFAGQARQALAERFHSWTTCAATDEALAVIEAVGVDLLIFDADSDIDGNAVREALSQKQRPSPSLPLIVCGDLNLRDFGNGLARGAAHYLHKGPALGELLRDAVDRMQSRAQLERRLTEARLPQVIDKALLESAIEATGVGSWVTNLRTGQLQCSHEYRELLGISAEGALPSLESLLTEIVDPADYTAAVQAQEKHVRLGEPIHLELRVIRRDGARRWLRAVGQLVRDESGAPWYSVGSIFDVTDQRDMSPQLQRSEHIIQAFTRNSREAILVVNGEGVIIYASSRNVRVSGRAANDVVDRTIWENLHPDDVARVSNDWKQVLAHTDQVRSMAVRYIHGDGTWRWIEATSQNFSDDPTIGGMIVNFRDVTARKRTEVFMERGHVALTQLISRATLEECLPSVLRAIDAHLPGARSLFVQSDAQSRYSEKFFAPNLPELGAATIRERVAAEIAQRFANEPPNAEPRLMVERGEIPLLDAISEYLPGRPVLSACWTAVVDADERRLGYLLVYFDHLANREWLAETLLGRAVDLIRLAIEHKSAENSLRESQLILEQALHSAGMGTLVRNIKNDELTPSNKALELFGLSLPNRALTYSEALQAIHPDDRARVDAAIQSAIENKGRYSIEYRTMSNAVTPRWLRCDGQAYFDENGVCTRTVSVCQDVTQRLLAAAALEQSEKRYRGLIERIPLAVFVSSNGRFVFANDAAVSLLGARSQAELLRRPATDFIKSDPHRRESRLLCELLEGDIPTPSTEASFIRPDGRLVEVEIRSNQCLFDGAPGLQVVLQEIGERKRADEEAHERQSQIAHLMRLNAIGQMAAELAHEINQPLYAITNYASAALELMESQRDTMPPESLGWLRNVADQANRAGTILRRIGRFVRKDPPVRERIFLNDALWDTAALLEFDLRSHGIRLNMTLTEPSPVVVVDRLQIEQVLVNLVQNAVHAMDQVPADQRNLTLRSRNIGDAVEVAVRDSGPGSPEETLTRLFQPFYTTKPSSLGLGLSISRSIIEAHRGRLWAEPNRDRGVTFRFTLPFSAESEQHDN